MPATRSFPGIVFQVETPLQVDLPRMDIAAFVGFAQRGPLHLPVVVESYGDFVNLFGDTYRLAWDGEQGLWQTACLATAVKAFFAQGGRRCWVVRVASIPRDPRDPLGQAELQTVFSLSGLLQFDPLRGYGGVTAIPRSAGSWADNLQTKVELLSDSLGFVPTTGRAGESLQLTLEALGNLTLQPGDLLQLDFGDRRHRAYVALPPLEQAADLGEIAFLPSQIHWFYRLSPSQLPLNGSTVHTVNAAQSRTTTGDLTTTAEQLAENPMVVDHATLQLADPLNVEIGDWLRIETGGQTLWLQVEAFINPVEFTVTNLWGQGFDETTPGRLAVERVQRLQLALRVRSLDTLVDGSNLINLTLSNLAGAPPHPRFIGYLPTDETLLARPVGMVPQAPNNPAADLWTEVSLPRFPLGMALAANTLVLPLGLETNPPWRSGHIPDELPLVRDGLVPAVEDYHGLDGLDWVAFLPTLFLDPFLRLTQRRSLLTEANDRLYLQGKALTGIHSLLPIEEVSLIALPDIAHRGWRLTSVERVSPPLPEPPAPLPDLCATDSPFSDCFSPEPTGSDPESGSESDPSELTPATQWQLLLPQEYFATGLLEIQQVIARLVAARGDCVALLGAPKHYRPDNLLDHQYQLLSAIRRAADNTDSFIALYHPWLVSRDVSGSLLHQPPAGAIAGIMAAQSLRQGAWLAPANEIIQDMLATVPPLAPADEQALYYASINPLKQISGGFVPWGNFTQSRDTDLEALNVRRLLILLRRLALREGQAYVFAPHSAAFRRRIKQQFEQVLNRLFTRGAFAGGDRTQAYRVVIDTSLNTPATIERGQLLIELRVAPSRPMTFITVRLVQSDSGQFSVQEVANNGR